MRAPPQPPPGPLPTHTPGPPAPQPPPGPDSPCCLVLPGPFSVLRYHSAGAGRGMGAPSRRSGRPQRITPVPPAPCRLTYETPEGRKEVKTRAVALTVPAYVAADLVAQQSSVAAEALKVSAAPPWARNRLVRPPPRPLMRPGLRSRGGQAGLDGLHRRSYNGRHPARQTAPSHPLTPSCPPALRRAWTTRRWAPSPWPTQSRPSARTGWTSGATCRVRGCLCVCVCVVMGG